VNAGSSSTPIIGRLERLYFPLLACVFGIFVFSGLTWLLPIYFSLGYLILGLTAVAVTRFWRDYLNPLLLILLMGFVRFSIPGFLSLRTEPDLLIFRIMGLERDAWILGHALALTGLLGVVVGWLFGFQLLEVTLRRIKLLSVSYSGGVPYAAILAMLVGSLALLVFVRSHASIGGAIFTGEIRGTEIQTGTGKFFYLSLMLIASSVIFSAYLNRRSYVWWITFLPTAVAASLFFTLGGRVRAFIPIAAGILLLWYRRDELKVSERMAFALAVVLLPVFSYAGQLYRGGLGLEGVSEIFSMSALAEYVNFAIWTDWGQLHALAGATAIGPGLLGGQTFSYNLLWPLSKFLDLPGKSAGVLIVQVLVGYSEKKWSFHASLIGDAYLNFGIIGVLVVTAIMGVILKVLYASFRRGQIDGAYYSLAAIYCLRMFFESVEKFGETLVILIFAFSVIRLGETLFNISPCKSWGQRMLKNSAG